MRKLLLVCLVITFTAAGYSEGLFESLFSSDEEENTGYSLNGNVRATMFTNRDVDDFAEVLGAMALKFRMQKGKYGGAYAELRFRENRYFSQEDYYNYIYQIDNPNIREAYIDLHAGGFDFRFGKQIVVWGRADAMNPTDIINPKDYLTRNIDEDERRVSNFLLKGAYTNGNFSIEGILVPYFKKSMTKRTSLNSKTYDNFPAKALKLIYTGAVLDGSISYFYGLNPDPVYHFTSWSDVQRYYYRIKMYGADFSTTFGEIGLRGEIAYKEVEEEIDIKPQPELDYVLGFDKSFNVNGNIILQYYGQYVEDFDNKNIMILSQTEEMQHSAICRLSHTFLYETLEIEDLARYNFTTDELFNRIKITYDITDAFEIVAGADYTDGPKGTQADQAKDDMSKAFTELKVSF